MKQKIINFMKKGLGEELFLKLICIKRIIFNNLRDLPEFSLMRNYDEFQRMLGDSRVIQNIEAQIELLTRNMDERSVLEINRIIHHWKLAEAMQYLNNEARQITADDYREQQNWLKAKEQIKKKYCLNNASDYSPEVFYYHHGIKFLPPKAKEYLKERDFLDVGAFNGDSALVLQEYQPRKIYCFEASEANVKTLLETMQNNNIESAKFEIVQSAVGEKSGQIKFCDSADSGAHIDTTGISVPVCSLDDWIKKSSNLNIALIKADIEGMGLDMLMGMKEVLKKFRPVLLLAIYHNQLEFFEIKPQIEELKLNYCFAIHKLCPGKLLTETTLIAYPEELAE